MTAGRFLLTMIQPPIASRKIRIGLETGRRIESATNRMPTAKIRYSCFFRNWSYWVQNICSIVWAVCVIPQV